MKLSWKVAEFDERGALRDEARAEDAKDAGKSCSGRGLEVLGAGSTLSLSLKSLHS